VHKQKIDPVCQKQTKRRWAIKNNPVLQYMLGQDSAMRRSAMRHSCVEFASADSSQIQEKHEYSRIAFASEICQSIMKQHERNIEHQFCFPP